MVFSAKETALSSEAMLSASEGARLCRVDSFSPTIGAASQAVPSLLPWSAVLFDSTA